MPRKTIMSVFGTRPEAIKLAPVIQAIEGCADLTSRVLVTAQHRELLDQPLNQFGIVPDVDLDLMRPGHTLAELTARVVDGVDRVLQQEQPDALLVQGDTTTVFAAGLAGFYRGVPVGHVEAGLRSFDLVNPFPEEANRRLVGQLAALHFAPTQRAEDNLLREGVPGARVLVTGNTAVDALQAALRRTNLPRPPVAWAELPPNACKLLVTLHRRESWGEPLVGICRALRAAVDALPHVHMVYPVHPQPRVQATVSAELTSHPRIALVEPLDYFQMVAAMKECSFIITDSGGIQEEAPALGKPVLVVRSVTERPEAVEAGTSWLVGTNPEYVFEAVRALATDRARHASMSHARSPFGDGLASERIVQALRYFLGLTSQRPEPFDPLTT
jgi:UDP-N-acetylglucosamine 2-epimerase (non-hydrolysing)